MKDVWVIVHPPVRGSYLHVVEVFDFPKEGAIKCPVISKEEADSAIRLD